FPPASPRCILPWSPNKKGPSGARNRASNDPRPSAAIPPLVFRIARAQGPSAAYRDQVRGVGGLDPASQLLAPPADRSRLQLSGRTCQCALANASVAPPATCRLPRRPGGSHRGWRGGSGRQLSPLAPRIIV